MSNCGPSQESCCKSLEVEGGTYYRTYDFVDEDGSFEEEGGATLAPDGGPSGEADPATVSGFRLDKYLVTVGRFRQFVNAVMPTDAGPGGYTPPEGSGKHIHLNDGRGLANSGDAGTYEQGWIASDDGNLAPTDANLDCAYLGPGLPDYSTWTPSAGSRENLPMSCMNWYESYAFCIWDGGFLPSESEWEYAAAGGGGAIGQREYPWGSTSPGTTSRYAIYGCNYDVGAAMDAGVGACVGVGNVASVGTAPDGAGYWGQLDLAGELFEWSLDWIGPYVTPCTDCAYLTTMFFTTDYRVNRGGLFNEPASTMLVPYRESTPPTDRSAGIGFRCARTP
jgi:formylglycine-generating enzyme required for sulfatase activity